MKYKTKVIIPEDEQLLMPNEVQLLLGVCYSTLLNWEKKGYIKPTYTPGGHRRYRVREIRALSMGRK